MEEVILNRWNLIGLTLPEIYTALIHSVETTRFLWYWKQFGDGPKLLLAFHGFNRSSDDFQPFGKLLEKEYTIVAFDLFFHGKSEVKSESESAKFTRVELHEAIENVLVIFQKKKFEVIAHSFGARLALNCVEIFGERVEGIYLMAPDAIRFNPGFWFSTQTRIGRTIMKRNLDNPAPVISFMMLLSKLGIYSQKSIDFYISHLTFEPVRIKVYKVWMAHGKTVPERKNVTAIIRKNKIRTILFFGNHDGIIPPQSGKAFSKEAGISASIHLLDSGHRLYEKHDEISKEILRNGK